MPRVVVVTDSTAVLPPAVAAAAGIEVVPLPVAIGGVTRLDGDAGTEPGDIITALTARQSVSTSRPAPATLVALYERLAEEGAEAVLAVHLTAEMSGTIESVRIAAARSPIEVLTVDTRMVGPAIGLAALAGAHALAGGATLPEAARAAMARAEASHSYFYVDSLEYLRRGGRIGAASALVGSALSVKPLLTLEDGRVVVKEKVRTSARALARLEDLTVEAAGEGPVDVIVAHLGAPERAEALVFGITERLAGQLDQAAKVVELGAVLGAHVGPGLVATCVAPALRS
jgi:DegV family protein with EDD domain